MILDIRYDTPQIVIKSSLALSRLDALGRPQTPGTYGLALGTAVGAIGGSVPRRAHPCAFVLTERVAWTLPLRRLGRWRWSACTCRGGTSHARTLRRGRSRPKAETKKIPVSRPGASGRGSAWTVGSACMDSGDTGSKTCRFFKYPCAPACPVCVPCVPAPPRCLFTGNRETFDQNPRTLGPKFRASVCVVVELATAPHGWMQLRRRRRRG